MQTCLNKDIIILLANQLNWIDIFWQASVANGPRGWNRDIYFRSI